ncbi:cytochrome P450 [Actinomadura rayongensis]|uniref:Cytochrome P450 n=1 Tax=Actinomadura rayongensis TaxID=1429076 RepID=A0A6I4WGX9_9ACTN|nr:cytochrome P450 [Actinomadura rayongensis]
MDQIDESDVDLIDPWFRHRQPDRWYALLAHLRTLDRPMYFREKPFPFLPHGDGYYALVTHADVSEATRDARAFRNAPTATVPETPRWLARYSGDMILDTDNPQHTRLRRIVSRAFTPRTLTRIDEQIRRAAGEIVRDFAKSGGGDIASRVAAPMPARIICEMMGVPRYLMSEVLDLSLSLAGGYDPGYGGFPESRSPVRSLATGVRLFYGSRRLSRIGMSVARERARRPTGDIASRLVTANPDGEHLTPRELSSFVNTLLVAGSETTHNAITHGIKLLTDHPAQRELLLSDLNRYLDGAIEEILRLSSPILTFRRTVAEERELGGRTFRPGDRVMLFYPSANRDERVFDRPEEFDITRDPNPHLAFGGPGPHYCLGAHLARRELSAVFRELFTQLPGLRAVGEPEYLVSPQLNGITRLDCTF